MKIISIYIYVMENGQICCCCCEVHDTFTRTSICETAFSHKDQRVIALYTML